MARSATSALITKTIGLAAGTAFGEEADFRLQLAAPDTPWTGEHHRFECFAKMAVPDGL